MANSHDRADQQLPSEEASECMTLPLELIDECVGKRLRAYLRDRHVFEGTLVGFDELVNLVLEDVVEVGPNRDGTGTVPSKRMLLSSRTLAILAPLE